MEASGPNPIPKSKPVEGDEELGYDPSKPIMTGQDLLESDVIGMWADRDDIGDAVEWAHAQREKHQRQGRLA